MEKLNTDFNIDATSSNMNELLEIIKIAIMKKDIVGCILDDVMLIFNKIIFYIKYMNVFKRRT